MAHFIKEGKMASNVLDTYLANAKVYNGSNAAIAVYNGSLVALGDLLADDTYDANGKEYDCYKAVAPSGDNPTNLAIVDFAGIQELADAEGNGYYMGINLYNLQVPAGKLTRVRRLALHDKFWLADGNFDTTPTVGQYAIGEASAFTHKAAAALGTGYGVKILDKKAIVTGMKDNGYMYLVEVVQL